MKKSLPLAAATMCLLALPLSSQESANEALRDLTYQEDNRVLAHLLSLLPEARDAAQLEAAVDVWVADLDPANTVTVRHRIEQLLRETPERDLYGVLLAVVQHRFRKNQRDGETPVSAASPSIGGPTGVSPPPLPYPAEDFRTIGRVGSQLSGAAGNCPQLRALAAELAGVTCNANYIEWGDQCRAARAQVADYANQLMADANC